MVVLASDHIDVVDRVTPYD